MTTNTDLIQEFADSCEFIYDWWREIRVEGSELIVAVDDPDHGEGSGKTIQRALHVDDLQTAAMAILREYEHARNRGGIVSVAIGRLAGDAILDHTDCDWILQYAVFGREVYA